MVRFLLRRLGLLLPVLLGVVTIVFFTIKLIPGDPAAAMVGPGATPEEYEAMREQLHLNDPIVVQFFSWLGNVIQGDLGMSIMRGRPVSDVVFGAFGNTLILALGSLVVMMVGGIVVGAISAIWPRSIPGRIATAVANVSVSAPQFSLALLLLVIFAVFLHIAPAGGMYTATQPKDFGNLLGHLVLPALAAGISSMGMVARMFSGSLRGILSQDFVESLRARGFGERRIFGHALHNALPSLLTISGLEFGYMLGGVVFVETIFSWPGLGTLVVGGVQQRDYPIVQSGVLIFALAFVLINLAVDTTHAVLDPRVRK